VSELPIVIECLLAGRVRADKNGRLSLTYEEAWRSSPQGHSLSISMPLADTTYPQKAIWPYLCNLLPENPTAGERVSTAHSSRGRVPSPGSDADKKVSRG
jgi:HipA-like protein